MNRFQTLWLIILLLPLLACEAASNLLNDMVAGEIIDGIEPEQQKVEIDPPDARQEEARLPSEPIQTKWDLWDSGETLLRGANIWQALVLPELDGPDFKGSGPVGPP